MALGLRSVLRTGDLPNSALSLPSLEPVCTARAQGSLSGPRSHRQNARSDVDDWERWSLRGDFDSPLASPGKGADSFFISRLLGPCFWTNL